mmetsp:Transcript_14660/g.25116  ORF Transcript_14660/g.25116 Transcript_14660/m.25116 type:complete len:240 (+) Transcript_14660:1498-2217(+)
MALVKIVCRTQAMRSQCGSRPWQLRQRRQRHRRLLARRRLHQAWLHQHRRHCRSAVIWRVISRPKRRMLRCFRQCSNKTSLRRVSMSLLWRSMPRKIRCLLASAVLMCVARQRRANVRRNKCRLRSTSATRPRPNPTANWTWLWRAVLSTASSACIVSRVTAAATCRLAKRIACRRPSSIAIRCPTAHSPTSNSPSRTLTRCVRAPSKRRAKSTCHSRHNRRSPLPLHRSNRKWIRATR